MAQPDISGRSLQGPPTRSAAAAWQARLRLRLAAQAGRTIVSERAQHGPVVAQAARYPEGERTCHLHLALPSGGLVGGDELTVRIDVTDAGHGLVTTPAATTIGRSNGPPARLDQRLTVSADAIFEWLPQGSIACQGSASDIKTLVILEQGARFIGWEIMSLGRPASGEAFDAGCLVQRLEVHREGEPLVIEQLSLAGSGPELSEPWGLGGHTTTATCIAVDPEGISSEFLADVRGALARTPMLASASCVSGALVVRILGSDARKVHAALTDVWRVMRPIVVGLAAPPPRIWAT